MISENRNLKVLMIVVNVLIWGYALYEVIPVLFGKDAGGPVEKTEASRRADDGKKTDDGSRAGRADDGKRTADDGVRTGSAARTDEGRRTDDGRRLDDPRTRDSAKGDSVDRGGRNPWKVADPVAFFARSRDPFLPFVTPVEGDSSAAQRRDRRVDFRLPRDETVEKKQVQTVYRLSSIFVINEKVLAILTAGQGSDSVTARVGQQLPDGDIVREINRAERYVIVEKEGHVFKLVDMAPFVILVRKP